MRRGFNYLKMAALLYLMTDIFRALNFREKIMRLWQQCMQTAILSFLANPTSKINVCNILLINCTINAIPGFVIISSGRRDIQTPFPMLHGP